MDATQIKGIAGLTFTKISQLIATNKHLRKVVFNLLVDEELDLNKEEEKEVFELRKDTCNKCKYNVANVCTRCSCLLDVKQLSKTNFSIKKGKMEITHCVEGKWNDANLVVFYNQ